VGLLTLTVGVATAAALTFTLHPTDLADGPTFDNGHGGEPFGYDPDMDPPLASDFDGPTGWGDSSWWSGLDPLSSNREYTTLRLSPKDIFEVDSVLLSEIDDLTYWTYNNEPTTANYLDWQVKIYTEPDDGTSWYDERIEFNRPTSSTSVWTQWDIGTLDLYKFTSKIGDGQPDPFTWAQVQSVYGDEEIMFIDIIAAYASGTPNVDSYLDGVELSIDQGSGVVNAQMNLIPEPSTALLLAAGLAGLAAARRRSSRR
jgi:hypothetical protein